jgi:hypothetical protein
MCHQKAQADASHKKAQKTQKRKPEDGFERCNSIIIFVIFVPFVANRFLWQDASR